MEGGDEVRVGLREGIRAMRRRGVKREIAVGRWSRREVRLRERTEGKARRSLRCSRRGDGQAVVVVLHYRRGFKVVEVRRRRAEAAGGSLSRGWLVRARVGGRERVGRAEGEAVVACVAPRVVEEKGIVTETELSHALLAVQRQSSLPLLLALIAKAQSQPHWRHLLVLPALILPSLLTAHASVASTWL
jgi:hypothetical protein